VVWRLAEGGSYALCHLVERMIEVKETEVSRKYSFFVALTI
jgi:hypothetical protein